MDGGSEDEGVFFRVPRNLQKKKKKNNPLYRRHSITNYQATFFNNKLSNNKDVLFIIEDWNAKVGSQETPGVTGKFGLGVRNEAEQRLIQSFSKRTHWS